MLDGIIARVNNKATRFGAFLDSLLDRYSDAFLFLSIAWYLASKGEHNGAFLSLGTLVGAFLISYARARDLANHAAPVLWKGLRGLSFWF